MKKVKLEKRIYFRWAFLAVSLVFIWASMSVIDIADLYARHIYPKVFSFLSRFSSLFPFSVGDCFIYGSIIGLLAYLIYALVRRKNIGKALRRIIEYLAWVYVWFYLAWGLNYFRHNFYTRAKIPAVAYAPDDFRTFLTTYTDSLNASWCEVEQIDTPLVAQEVKSQFRKLPPRLGLVTPPDYLRAKPMLISSLMSRVGVRGYMGPFFCEFNLNRNLLPVEYPFTYAHEMAHALGITGEAEANLYGYLICITSEEPEIRFSGYLSLFTYVLGNAHRLLPQEEYIAWINTVRPEVKEVYNKRRSHWISLYDSRIGDMQEYVYNIFLKSNNIPTGTANYSEVIALLIAVQKNKL